MADQSITESDRVRFWSKVRKTSPDECWEWQASKNFHHYGSFALGGRAGRRWLAHRVAWLSERGPIPVGMCVLHRCDNPSCVNPAHLFLGTKKDNSLDMARKGRARGGLKYGVENKNAKLTDESVSEILSLLQTGISQDDIGERFGVCQTTVSNIATGRIWAHVPR